MNDHIDVAYIITSTFNLILFTAVEEDLVSTRAFSMIKTKVCRLNFHLSPESTS